jgi:hypothetical protein
MVQVICKYCNACFETKEKNRSFCSQSCSAKQNNTLRTKKKLKYCLHCSKLLSNNKKIYCNNTCQHLTQRNLKIDAGLEKCSASFIRNYMINKYAAKCMKCGWCEINQTTGKVPIELNHIDGNSENNNLINLELLCPNCHSLTSNYKALNKGNGRYKRRERYRNNKSF